jgi:hypothetical protein
MSAAPSIPEALLRKRLAKKRKPMGWVDHFPIEDPRQTQKTLSPHQLKISLLALDMEQAELKALFGVTQQTVKNWSAGRTSLPKGIADYLRLKVAQRIRALSIGTGTPVSLEEDMPDKVPTMKSLAAIEEILSTLRAYLAA